MNGLAQLAVRGFQVSGRTGYEITFSLLSTRKYEILPAQDGKHLQFESSWFSYGD